MYIVSAIYIIYTLGIQKFTRRPPAKFFESSRHVLKRMITIVHTGQLEILVPSGGDDGRVLNRSRTVDGEHPAAVG